MGLGETVALGSRNSNSSKVPNSGAADINPAQPKVIESEPAEGLSLRTENVP
jgi:hypothetical protein